MSEKELQDLVEKPQLRKCEDQKIEVKKAFRDDCSTNLRDILSSFSNRSIGEIIVFGLDEDAGFSVSGVYDAQDLQHKVMAQNREMVPQVCASFTTTELNGKVVVPAELPPQDVFNRLVCYKEKGRLDGSFVWVGDTDERMPEFEVMEDVKTGVCFTEGDGKNLIERIVFYLSNENNRKEMAKHCQNVAWDNYTMNNMVSNFIKAIETAHKL